MKRRRRSSAPISKALKADLKKDGYLLSELMVAEKLGYTLFELRERMTPEELEIWMVFYHLRNDEEKAAQEKALQQSRRRR